MKKFTAFFSHPAYPLLNITVVLMLLITLPLLILSSLKPQNIQQKATGPTCQTLPLTIPVLALGYFPPDPTNTTYIDPNETGWTPQHYATYGIAQPLTIPQWHSAVDTMINKLIPELTDNTRYHGYKDPQAQPFLTFQIVNKKYYDVQIPHGVRDTEPGNPYRPDYHKILTDQNICNYVDTQGVKEVWIFSYHSNGVSPDESRMSSKYGDISNSFPNGTNVDPTLILPVCNHSYVLYNYESLPTSSINNSVHNRMHQIENTISYADNNYRVANSGLFWGNFAHHIGEGGSISCGDTHVPPNTTAAYHYAENAIASSNCETWNPDSSKTQFKNISCTEWGCTDINFYKWWMQNNPGYNNGITYNGQQMRNWWEAMYDFNGFIDKGKSLFGSSLISCTTTPPPPSAGPTLSPTQNPSPTSPLSENVFSLILCPHGLGNCGDNANPNGGGNTQPQQLTRTVTLTVLNAQGQPVGTGQGNVTYNSSVQNFQGSVAIPALSPGQYLFKVKLDGFLSKQLPGIISVTKGQTIPLPQAFLTTGDVNHDDQLDILDYNLLIACYGDKANSPSCTAKQNADITNDGIIDGVDYNLFLRELSVQHG